MKKTRHLLLTLFLVAALLFGLCVPTVAYALTSTPEADGDDVSEPSVEGGGLDLEWFTVEYTADKITITLRPDVKSLLGTDRADVDSIVSSLIDAIMYVVAEDIKDGFIDDQYGDNGGVNVEGIDINNVFDKAIDNFVASLDDAVLSLDSDPYVAFFKASVKDDGNTLVADLIAYASNLIKFACKAGYITVEQLDSYTDEALASKIDAVIKAEIESSLTVKVEEYADEYVNWLVDDIAHNLSPEVEKIIADAVTDYVIDLRERYIAETLDLTKIAELAFSEYIYEEFNHEAEAKFEELLDKAIWDQVKALPTYDESLSEDAKLALYNEIKTAYLASPDYVEDHDEFLAEAWAHKGEKIREAVREDNAIEYLHEVLHTYKLSHPEYFDGVTEAIIEIAENSTELDMDLPPVSGDIRDEAFKLALGIGHAEFNATVDGYIADLIAGIRTTADEVRGIDTELSFEDAFAILKTITVNGKEIFGLGDDGVSTFKMDALKALIAELPTLSDIKNFTLEEMALSFDVVIGTEVGNSSFNVTLAVGSGDAKIRAVARLLDEYLDLSFDGATANVSLTVPARVTELLLDACSSDKIDGELKLKIFSLLDGTVDEFYAKLAGFTFEEIKDIITSDSLDFVRNSDFINTYIDIASLSDEEIVAKLDQLKPIYERAMGYIETLYASAPGELKDKTLFDLYELDGQFSLSASYTVSIEQVERALEKLSPEYGLLLSTYIPEFEKTVTLNANISFTDVYMVEYDLGTETRRGMLPVGADLAFFADTTVIDGKNVIGWADANGTVIVTMPACDVALTPVFEDLAPDLPDTLTWDYTGKFVSDGFLKNVAIITDLIDLNYYEVVYEGTCTASVAGKYTAVAKVVEISTGDVKMETTLNWQIVDPVADDLTWVGNDYYYYTGESFTLTLAPGQFDTEVYRVEYQNNSASEIGNYVATATVYDIETGASVKTFTKDYRIIPAASIAWDYQGAFYFDGSQKTVALNTGSGYADSEYYTVEYQSNSASAMGNYTATATVKVKGTDDVALVDTLAWSIIPKVSDIAWNYTTAFTYDATEKTVSLDTSAFGADFDRLYRIDYDGNTATNIGRYTAVAKVYDRETGALIGESSVLYVIESNIGSLVFGENEFVYDGTEKTVGVDESYLANNFSDLYYIDWAVNTATEIGSYTATATVKVKATDATVTSATLDWEIVPDMALLTWNYDTAFIYDGTEKRVELNVSALGSGFTANYYIVYSENAKTAVGTYTAVATVYKTAGDEQFGTTMTKDWSIISDIPADLTWSSNPVYNGREQAVTLVDGQIDETKYTVTYENNKATNAGNYTATVVIKGSDGSVVYTETYDWSITAYELDLSQFAWNYTANLVYDGSLKTVTLAGYPDFFDPSFIIYTANTATDAGNYTASAVIDTTLATNFTVKDGTAIANLKWSIAKADIDMSGVTFVGASFVYDGAAHSIYVNGLPNGVTVSYLGNGVTAAGAYNVTATFKATDSKNYNNPASMIATIKVLKVNHFYPEGADDTFIEIHAPEGIDPEIDVIVNSAIQNYIDGITVNGAHREVISAYDVSFYKGIVEQDMNGAFTVRLRIPERYLERDDLVVVHIDDFGKATVVESTRDGEYMVFNVSHFSIYAITVTGEEECFEGRNNRWIIILIAILAVLLVVAIIIVIIKLKKKGKDDEDGTEPTDPTPTDDEPKPEPEAQPVAEETVPVVEEPAKEPIEEPVEEEPVVEEPVVEEEPAALEPVAPETVVVSEPVVVEAKLEPVVIPVTDDGADGLKAVIDGEVVMVRYRSSFQSRLIQSDEDIQGYYTVLKNKLLSYKGVKARTSWNFESFNKARLQCAKLNIKGKAILLYINLDTAQYNASKYHFQDVSDKPKFADVPMMLKVKSDRGLKYALELIEELMAQLEIPGTEPKNVDYRMPYETTEALAKKGLIKVILPKGMQLDENMNLIKMNVSDLLDGVQKAPKAEPAPEAVAEPTPEVVEEPAALEPVEEPVIETPIVVEHAHVKPEEVVHVDAVHADEMLVDEEAELVIEHIHTDVASRKGKLSEINLDIICENFEDGETVTVKALIERRLVSKNTARVKVLARGVMTKALTIIASKFSLQAVKMITLAGGAAEMEE